MYVYVHTHDVYMHAYAHVHTFHVYARMHARTHLDDEGVGEVVDGDLVNAVDLLPLRVRVPTGKCARACARARERVCVAWLRWQGGAGLLWTRRPPCDTPSDLGQ